MGWSHVPTSQERCSGEWLACFLALNAWEKLFVSSRLLSPRSSLSIPMWSGIWWCLTSLSIDQLCLLFLVYSVGFHHRNRKQPRKVEKNTICRKLLPEHFPETCLGADVFELLKDRPKRWSPEKLKLAKWFWCHQHKEEWLGDYIDTAKLLYSIKILIEK